MILVVDAYNVLKQVSATIVIDDATRRQFVQECAYYAQQKGLMMIVVFDGGPARWPSQQQVKGVTVVYSGWALSADDYIKEYILGHKEHEKLLVSSDRALCTWASHHSTQALQAREFYAILQEVVNKSGIKSINYNKAIKTTKDDNAELDELMYQLDDEAHKVEHSKLQRKSPAKKPSKEERAMAKKIKKL